MVIREYVQPAPAGDGGRLAEDLREMADGLRTLRARDAPPPDWT
jgi:hypothetical protein